ncbi:hypothetical protein OK015_01235 [Mycobacterium sp. Aquia_216]|uniref:hypothetical protein n=1 Tax=Mycobacterium sp. Aquia_216 TaxID=2991729 RepID=UPI00227C1034|nr:hypothetical protein [Mycobacterium sp. Aquia_216]WAJ45182.1 hypothetical protein OK015_01235 [Mycobacterium sp. Aquia_216]
MTESLVVDPARLKTNGIAVRDQVLPAAPPPISATGADSVSAAINQTMPIIESPVITGLPDVQAALTNTGSKIVTAAEMYAQTDQLLGEHVAKVQFLATAEPAGTDPPARAAAPRLPGAETTDKNDDKTPDKKPDKKPQPAAPSNLNQLAGLTQAAQPLTQGMQGLMQSVQQAGGGMGNAGAAPAKLADDTKKDGTQEPADESRLVDATTKDADGAASGKQGSGSAPVQAPAGGRPQTTQPETAL